MGPPPAKPGRLPEFDNSGSPASEVGREENEGPQTEVLLTRGFWLGRHQVTQEEYQAVTGANPSHFKGASLPVENVTWDMASDFCRQLTEQERDAGKLPAGYEYRLPTEAQWEYCCRAGETAKFSYGDSDRSLVDYAWYKGKSSARTHPVGQKRPNPWGLYDMHGNVFEWCGDWYAKYPGGSVTDPKGPSSGSDRIARGGCYCYGGVYCRSASRQACAPTLDTSSVGFRVALVPISSTDTPESQPSGQMRTSGVALGMPHDGFENWLNRIRDEGSVM